MTVHNNTENEAGPAAEAPEIPLPLSLDESTSPFVQEGVARKNLQEAKISYLDGSQQSFYVHKNADAEVLFNMVVAQLNLIEKDYFALSFFNELNIRLWLYKEKKIAKQLKGRPWEFELIVKFYPPEPDQLVEDFTRHLMVLQLRHDVYTERLPFVFEKLALLGSYVAQSELGDYQPHEQYDDYLRGAKIAPIITDELIRRVRDLHRDIQKGQTKSEAEFKYLEACAKGHHLYGVWRFDAKDSKGNPVQVGVSAHGIGIYNGDTGNPRLHMFAWQDIIKIAYRRNAFSIKLKEGVMDAKKEVNVNYRLADYPASKRLWKCGVEHHTFFRLVQAEPDIKPKHGLFRWGSSRFRYSGRTQLQTRMASNSYANSPGSTMQRTESGRVISKSVDDIAQKQHASPLRFADDPTQSKDLISSPEKSYPVSEIESDKKKKKKKDKRKAEDEQLAKAKKDKKEKKEKEKKKAKKDKKKAKKAKKGEDVSSTSSSSSDSASDAEVEKRFIVIPGQAGSSGDQVVPTGVLGRAKELHEIGEEEQQDVSTPHTTVHTWHETTSGPEEVTTEVDEHGNVITRTKKTQQVKHTIQKQSYQTFSVNDGQPGTQTVERSHQTITPIRVSPTRSPVLETHTRTIAYEAGDGQNGHNGTSPTNGHNGAPGEFVSSKTVTSGNRTIETITYKVEKDGVTETHVEHRVTIHSGDDIDHDAELSQAILEATQMNPHMTVEKIEVKQETTC